MTISYLKSPTAVGKRDGHQLGLLRVQVLRLRKLEQRADVIGLRRVNDDHALALLELIDQVQAINRRADSHGHGDEKPEPRQPVALGEQLSGIESFARRAKGWRCAD